jgi:release factor glutamine methyltransferase
MLLPDQRAALVALGGALRDTGYRFITPTPETHRRVVARRASDPARDVRDVFGWSLPFHRDVLPGRMFALGEAAGIFNPMLEDGAPPAAVQGPGAFVSTVRFSTLTAATGEHLFVHSAYPTTGRDAVFFGPDSYRFAACLARTIWKGKRLVDVGCGTGVGGLVLASRVEQVVLADVSTAALELAAVNVALAGREGPAVALCESDILAGVDGDADVIISNPPYIAGPETGQDGRLYRDGGGALGTDLAARITLAALARLADEGGQLLLYTGVPIVAGRNVLQDRLEPGLREGASSWHWEEIDPDVFGEELARPAYRDVERIAVVALHANVN